MTGAEALVAGAARSWTTLTASLEGMEVSLAPVAVAAVVTVGSVVELAPICQVSCVRASGCPGGVQGTWSFGHWVPPGV